MLHFIGNFCFSLTSGLYCSAASTQDYSLSVRIKTAVGQRSLEHVRLYICSDSQQSNHGRRSKALGAGKQERYLQYTEVRHAHWT